MIFNVEKENWREIGVYRILNSLNGKTYIGSTTTNFRHRYLQYKSGFLRKLDNQPVLYRAFRKYGFENFIFEIVCITSKEETLSVEQSYIDKGSDYNSCLVAGSLQGYKHPNDAKTRTVKGGNHHCSKSVDQYTLDGVFIKTFNSIVEACQAISKSKNVSSHIMAVCNGKALSLGGYRWTHQGETLKQKVDKRTLPITQEKRIKMSKPRVKNFKVFGVFCEDILTKDVIYFRSIKEASECLDMLRTSIQNNISKRSKTVKSRSNNKKYNFTWDRGII